MQPGKFYKERLISLHTGLALLRRKKTTLAWLRFATLLGLIACWYFLIGFGLVYVLACGLLIAVLFTRLVFADLNNRSAIEHQQQLIKINEDELKALEHNYYHFADGSEYMPAEHAYANDLDIFGHASLYQYMNRTNSEMGGMALAAWLSAPARATVITGRQTAIKELVTLTHWRQQLQGYGAAKRIKKETQVRLQQWFADDERFLNNSLWMALRYLVPVLVITMIALNMADIVSNYTRNYCLLASALLALYTSKKVMPLHQQVSKMSDELEVLSESIALVEQANFKSAYLQDLQNKFRQQQGKASAQLKQLKKILERLDLRFNFVVFIPLDVLLQWDLQQVIALETWKRKNHQHVIDWFDTLGEFEAINSFATLYFNNPNWCFPVLAEEHFYIAGTAIGHPLIPAGTCVDNPLKLDHAGEIMLVTGSNMAGKSTYLRSVGIATVMAMAGSAVCARQFSLSPVQVISSMRIADNLAESTSTFYAELKKLKAIIEKVNKKEKVFILLDEILRGTNSLDRHTGSAALIKQLIRNNAACIIATHDVELAKLKETYPDNILNYHFDVQVSHEELFFDYRLKEGVCTSLNASILMKKIGIEL